MKKDYVVTLSLKIRGCDVVLAEGFSPGVIATQVITAKAISKERLSRLAAHVVDGSEAMIKEYVTVEVTHECVKLS